MEHGYGWDIDLCSGALFVSKAFDEQSKEKIQQIVEEIRLTFLETLPQIDWMDEATRRHAHEKATLMISNTHW